MRGPDFRFGAHETRAEQPPDDHPCPRVAECPWGFARGFRVRPRTAFLLEPRGARTRPPLLRVVLVPPPCPFPGVLLLVCYSYLARALLAPTRARATFCLLLLARYSFATRPLPLLALLLAALRSYSFATRARRVPVPVGARGCAVPFPLRTRSLPLYPPPAVLPEQARAQSPKASSRRAGAAEKSNKQFGHPAAAFSGVGGVTAGAAAAAAPSLIAPSKETPSARTPARPHSTRDVPARLWRREPPVTMRAARAARAPPAVIRAGEGSLRTDDQREDARQGRGRPETRARAFSAVRRRWVRHAEPRR